MPKLYFVYTHKKSTAFPQWLPWNPQTLNSITCRYKIPNYAHIGKYVWEMHLDCYYETRLFIGIICWLLGRVLPTQWISVEITPLIKYICRWTDF